MFNFSDLFQWERFITPSIIQIFYWLMLGVIALFGLSGIAAAIAVMPVSLIQGTIMLFGTLLGVAASVLFTRIASELVLMIFRINEHLGAIRNRGEM
jgi:hypothetical protein